VPNSYIPVVLLGIVAALNIISTVLALLAL
jgi:hypothetical protein